MLVQTRPKITWLYSFLGLNFDILLLPEQIESDSTPLLLLHVAEVTATANKKRNERELIIQCKMLAMTKNFFNLALEPK